MFYNEVPHHRQAGSCMGLNLPVFTMPSLAEHQETKVCLSLSIFTLGSTSETQKGFIPPSQLHSVPLCRQTQVITSCLTQGRVEYLPCFVLTSILY
jgi:hypothetical protein